MAPLAMISSNRIENPLASNSMRVWDELVEALNPASLLVLVDRRMSAALKAHHSAEDILQDALLHAWRDRQQCQWQGLRHFRAWVISIIDHRIHDAADFIGTQKRGGDVPHVPLRYHQPGQSSIDQPMVSTTPSRVAIYREQASTMLAALSSLPPDLHDVVRLRLFEQMPLEAIATHLGIGVAAVRHRFRKGVALYQTRLRESGDRRSAMTFPDSAPALDENASSHE